MNWSDRILREWQALLEETPATLNGEPNPAFIKILESIDRLLKTGPQIRMARLIRRTRMVAVPIASLILAFVMYFSWWHNSVRLAATAKSLSLATDSESEMVLLAELPLKKLVARPVHSFETSCTQQSGSVASFDLDHPGGTITIRPTTQMRLDSLTLPPNTQVNLSVTGRHQGLAVELSHPNLPQGLTGTIAGLPGKESCIFSITIQDRTTDLTLQPAGTGSYEPLSAQIPIRAAAFGYRNVESGRSISAINSGTLSLEDIPDAKYVLERGANLSMDLWKGTLADFHVSDDEMSFLLVGDVSRVRLGYRDKRDITPTMLQRLRTKSSNIELWIGLFYIIAILYGFGVVGPGK